MYMYVLLVSIMHTVRSGSIHVHVCCNALCNWHYHGVLIPWNSYMLMCQIIILLSNLLGSGLFN